MKSIGGYFAAPKSENEYSNSSVISNPTDQAKRGGTITPLTIRKLLQVSTGVSDVVQVDGVHVDQAVIIGRVRHIEYQSTRIILVIEDSTAEIQLAFYKTVSEFNDRDRSQFICKQDTYVKALVLARPLRNQKLWVTNNLQTVQDYNEITCHFLTTFVNQAARKKGFLEKPDPTNYVPKSNSKPNNGDDEKENSNPLPIIKFQNPNAPKYNPEADIKKTISDIQLNSRDGKCRLSALQQAFAGKLQPSFLRNYLRKLEYNGEIFHDQNKQDLGYSLLENL